VPGAVHGMLVPPPTPATVGGSAGSSGTVFHAAIE